MKRAGKVCGDSQDLKSPGLFALDGTLDLPSDKYKLMKQTENIAVPNSQNLEEHATSTESRYRVEIVNDVVQVQSMKKD